MSKSTGIRATKKAVIDALQVERSCPYCGRRFIPTRKQCGDFSTGRTANIVCSAGCYNAHERTAESRSKTSIALRNKRKTGGLNQRIEHNSRAKFYCIQNRYLVKYTFRNLYHFVREHPELFPEGCTDERPDKSASGNLPKYSNAAIGLSALFATSIRRRQSYHGWTAVWKKDSLGKYLWHRITLDSQSDYE